MSMKRIILTAILVTASPSAGGSAWAATPVAAARAAEPSVDFGYKALTSASALQDANFYLLTLIEQDADAHSAFAADAELRAVGAAVAARIAGAATACETTIEIVSSQERMPPEAAQCTPKAGLRSADETRRMAEAAGRLFDRSAPVRALVRTHIRPSGYFQSYAGRPDRELFLQAWADSQAGIDRIIRVYGLGEAPRYPSIDAAIYPVESVYYRGLVADVIRDVAANRKADELAYRPALALALQLMEVNRRDDAVRQTRMQDAENAGAETRLATVRWADYPYAAILVPGHSPEIAYEPLNPNAKIRIRKAVALYREGKAPVIVVSGGSLRPAGTPYTEALEMKRHIVAAYGLPGEAVLIDPLARHTTTNLRNTARLLFRVGAPAAKPSLVVGEQVPYIVSALFRTRNENELGYVPYVLGKRLAFDLLEFTPPTEALHRDASDPMDP